MRYLIALLCVLTLSACAGDEAEWREANLRTHRLATGDSASVQRARVELERMLVNDDVVVCGRRGMEWGAGGGRAAYADSAQARMCARLGFVRWTERDTAGALAAYRASLPYAHLQRDDSARAVVIRDAAFVSAASGDTATALLVLDDAERVARAHGLNTLARTVLRCKEVMLRAGLTVPCEPPDARRGGAVEALLIFGAIVVAFLVGHVRRRANRG